ncbi:MAG: hypothetical protein FWG68_06285 [Defluviitaleaceae bacterium]|nr:hypothetical protein [Defluviitaleaceae bacterium]
MGRATDLRILLLKHWGLDGRATDPPAGRAGDGRPYLTAVRRAGSVFVGATVLGRPFAPPILA